MDRSNVENALAQVLENFQRCGILRFGALPAEELPAEMLVSVAHLTAVLPIPETSATSPNMPRRPVVGPQPTAAPPQGDASPTVARRSTVGSEPVTTTPETTSQRASEPVPSIGLAKEPWSLPVLSLDERQSQLEGLAGQVRDCRLCSAIVSYRQQTVFGAGPLNPRVCFMGEAPGADEDRTGQPFVGKAGQLLTKIITAMQLRRDEVYILNALKCRPPQNRTPMNEEIEHCRHFVESQLDILRPEFIVCLGAVAVRSILRSEAPIGRLRGQFYQYRGARVVVTYHPSYLLRNESAKKHVWEDMKMLMAELSS